MIESVERLRKYVAANTDESYVLTSYPPQYRVVCSTMINDLIDAIEREVESNYIELPKDADDEVWRVGDLVVGEVNPDNPQRVERMLWYGPDSGWQLETDSIIYTRPERSRHHKPPTVEDVLDEFASAYDRIGGEDEEHQKYLNLIADFAAKLQLRVVE